MTYLLLLASSTAPPETASSRFAHASGIVRPGVDESRGKPAKRKHAKRLPPCPSQDFRVSLSFMHPTERPARILLDFGFVLTAPQDTSVFDSMLAEFDLGRNVFLDAWSRHRRDYDEGIIDARAYWMAVLAACGLAQAESLAWTRLDEFVRTDIAAWMRPRLAVHALLEGLLDSGVELAILSNMPPGIGSRFVAAWPWIGKIRLRFFSGDEGYAKPDAAFYRHFLERSGWQPEHTLFVDDTAKNIEAAAVLGFAVHHFIDEAAALEAMRSWARRYGR
jgi:putative hydrolase of the HAD superfamily